MEIQETIKPAQPVIATGCCPPFDPAAWHEKEIVWKDKLFVADHVHSIFHVPIDMKKKVLHDMELIEAAGAKAEKPLMLSDERSPFGADLFIDVVKPVPGARMTTLSGTFLTRVYEGPYREARQWIADMREYVEQKGYILDQLFLGYPMCPACAEAYGKNQVIVFARVETPPAKEEAAQYV